MLRVLLTKREACTRGPRIALATTLLLGSALGAPRAEQPFPIQTPGEIQQSNGTWQVPGQIEQPKGTWQTPGAIQVPKGIQAIKQVSAKCQQRLAVGADALFDFDKSDLNPDAEKTLGVLGPMILKFGHHPSSVEGHTDSIGSDEYNQRLSERRAQTVKSWLVAHNYLSASTHTTGYGRTRPVAPNTKPDGSDNPQGRQQNRRVEVVIEDTCRP